MAPAATPKLTIPAPSLVHYRGGPAAIDQAVYPDIDVFWEDLGAAYADEVRRLAALGCTYLQLDDTSLAYLNDPAQRAEIARRGEDAEHQHETYIRSINRALRDKPAGMTVTTHMCRGNFRSSWVAQGGYDFVADALFNELTVDGYFMEFDDERSGGFAPLRFVPKGKYVVLGLVTSKKGELEAKDDLKRRIEEASKFVDIDQLCLSPQCGFSSTMEGNSLSRDAADRQAAPRGGDRRRGLGHPVVPSSALERPAVEDHRGSRELPEPGAPARLRTGLALVLPQAAVVPGRQRRSRGPAARMRAALLRGRGGAGDRAPGQPGGPRRGLGSCRLGDGRQRLRRLRPALRRPRRQRPLQGHRRADAARPAAARRPRDRSRRAAPAHLEERADRAGRQARRGTALRPRRHRRGPVPADDPGTGRRHPDRNAGRVDGRRAGRPGRDRGHRRGRDVGKAAQPDRRGPVHPAGVRRDAADDGGGPGRRVRRQRPAERGRRRPPAPRPCPRRCWPSSARYPPPRWPPSCASGG